MPQSLVSNNIHIVFSTKGRRKAIAAPEEMCAYLGGICKNIRIVPIAIGGMKDHVHLLLSLPADASIAETVGTLKANSSKWAGKQFEWQRGYAAFSVSRSNVQAVAKYIARQEEHHKVRSFDQELAALLKKHGVAFDERYFLD